MVGRISTEVCKSWLKYKTGKLSLELKVLQIGIYWTLTNPDEILNAYHSTAVDVSAVVNE